MLPIHGSGRRNWRKSGEYECYDCERSYNGRRKPVRRSYRTFERPARRATDDTLMDLSDNEHEGYNWRTRQEEGEEGEGEEEESEGEYRILVRLDIEHEPNQTNPPHFQQQQQQQGRRQPRSILRIATVEESLRTIYGGYLKNPTQGQRGDAGSTVSSVVLDLAGYSTSQQNRDRRGIVRFHRLQIREYDRHIGDHPSVSSGPPIGLGWSYDPRPYFIGVDHFELIRPPRRYNTEMIMPRSVRERILRLECGHSQMEIAAAVRNVIRVKNRRRQTVVNLGAASTVEEFAERLGKGFQRMVGVRKSSKHQIQRMVIKFERQQRLQSRCKANSSSVPSEVMFYPNAIDCLSEFDDEDGIMTEYQS